MLNVGKELAALNRQSMKELRQRYAEVFGEPTNANNKVWLLKRIVWRLQSQAKGGLSEGDLSPPARDETRWRESSVEATEAW